MRTLLLGVIVLLITTHSLAFSHERRGKLRSSPENVGLSKIQQHLVESHRHVTNSDLARFGAERATTTNKTTTTNTTKNTATTTNQTQPAGTTSTATSTPGQSEQPAAAPPIPYLYIGIGVGVFAVLCLLCYCYRRQKNKAKVLEFTMNPEIGLPGHDREEVNYSKNIIYEVGKTTDFLDVKKEQDAFGAHFLLKFKQPKDYIRTILLDFPINVDKPKHKFYYFEIEFQNVPEDCDVSIGYQSLKDYKLENAVGDTTNSVGIHSMSGTVYQERRILHAFGFAVSFGETIGIELREGVGVTMLE